MSINVHRIHILENFLFPNYSNNDESYQLYDVFNHSHERGGFLNITASYVWSPEMGTPPQQAQTKRQRRLNFNGLTLKAVVTVMRTIYVLKCLYGLSYFL